MYNQSTIFNIHRSSNESTQTYHAFPCSIVSMPQDSGCICWPVAHGLTLAKLHQSMCGHLGAAGRSSKFIAHHGIRQEPHLTRRFLQTTRAPQRMCGRQQDPLLLCSSDATNTRSQTPGFAGHAKPLLCFIGPQRGLLPFLSFPKCETLDQPVHSLFNGLHSTETIISGFSLLTPARNQ